MAKDKVFTSHRALHDYTTGNSRRDAEPESDDYRSIPAGPGASHVAPSSTRMGRHERTGEPIYSNEPTLAKPRGMAADPVFGGPAGRPFAERETGPTESRDVGPPQRRR